LLTRTRFSFSLARSGEARLEVRDVAGRSVIVLAEGALAAGVHSVAWDGRDSRGDYVRPGVYFARLEARPDGERLAAVVRRIVVLR
jgi:flagellar hook assembly protein FlgD